ncbi:hypothetical protein KSC_090330 [Ktedonobacter sp. SOSP1-52]|nr:hypothetical protein KSC_090330 [Ktedonobacter sp. SOSP1-52]
MPEVVLTQCLGWCAEHGLRTRIGIHNGIGMIENKEGAWKRLKHGTERVTPASRDTFGLFGLRHRAVAFPFTYPHP